MMVETDFQLIEKTGRVRQGLFERPVGEINYRDFRLRTPMGKEANAFQRWFGFNQFQFMSAISPELIVCAAIVDVRIAVTSFVYIYHPKSSSLNSYQFKAPGFGSFSKVNQTPDKGLWFFRQGSNSVELNCNGDTRVLTVRLKDGTTIDMNMEQGGLDPIRLATRVDINGFAYTQKMAGAPCNGKVSCKAGEFDLKEIGATATLDWSAGYLKRRCFWNWVCLSAILPDGRRLGLNGACSTNETSFNENGFWLDGKLHRVSGVAFDYDLFDLNKTWRITSEDGKIDLT
ncbi:DUF2804 domain-containing protein, partial [Sansalvadorimonas verongulae]|uniref:DUF2804 domain-containing protein n=1 Tax=Sansalvadorimonas verongulae TaxID=2172824 RepID=UPI0018AD1ED5